MDQIVPQIEAMARAQAGQRDALAARLEAGLAQWRQASAEPERIARLPRERNEPRMALPTHEPLDHRPRAAAPPACYAALAVDGSQIEPDFHEIAPCYLINVGHALLRYGPGAEGTRLASEPALFYPEASGVQAFGDPSDPTHPSDPSDPERLNARTPERLPPDDDLPFGTWGDLDAQRMLAEAEALAGLLQEEAPRGEAAVAFLDGPLIAWRLDWITPQAAKQAAARNFLRSFSEAKATGVPLAGYISRTRSTDLVNLLKYSACPTAVATGSFCAACAAGFWTDLSPGPSPARGGGTGAGGRTGAGGLAGSHNLLPSPAREGGTGAGGLAGSHNLLPSPRRGGAGGEVGRAIPCYAAFDGLLDRQLLACLLPEPGMRSPVFASNSSVLSNLYGEHRGVGFFFLNTGGEIGRVELPQWVWEDPDCLARVHALVWDQVTLGRGYPIVLAEAHEQAVVAASERSLFFDLVRRAYGRHDVAAELSAKALRKRGPIA